MHSYSNTHQTMYKRIIFALMALLVLASCGTTRYSSGVKIKEIKNFAFIQPCAYIDMYWTDGGYYNQPNTDLAAQMVTNVINSERFPFTEMIPADYYSDNGANNDAFQWAMGLPDIKASDIDRMRVPKSLIQLLENNKERYGLFIYTYGYVTTVEAYEKEKREKAISKAVDDLAESLTGVKGLTNPSRSYTPSSPYGNEMVCVVIDKDENRLVYYTKKTPSFPSHPTDNEDVRDILHALLKDFIR